MRRYIILMLLAACVGSVQSQEVVRCGNKGSYASYPPLSVSRSKSHGGDQSYFMEYRKLNIHERNNQPIPTNDWWTNMINGDDHVNGNDLTGHLWSYPLYVQATRYGLDVKYPNYWLDNGTEMKAHTKVMVKGVNYAPSKTMVQWWHDWDVAFSLEDGDKMMYTTMVHGMPFTWVEMHNVVPTIQIARDEGAPAAIVAGNMQTVLLQQDGVTPLVGEQLTDGFIIGMTDDADGMTPEYYGVFLPEKTTVSVNDGVATLHFYSGQQFVVVATLPSKTTFATFKQYAYNVPRDTKVTWSYDAAAGKVHTYWDITAENLLSGAGIPDFDDEDTKTAVVDDEPDLPGDDGTTTVDVDNDPYSGPAYAPRRKLRGGGLKVLQGFLPHHYRDYNSDNKLAGEVVAEYRTPHGILKMVEGTHFQIDYDFYGMLPYYPVPYADDDATHPYNESMMLEMLTHYANTGSFGADTYWGGKGLTQMALNMMFAREMGEEELYRQCHSKLKAAMVDWLTYTPGERRYFFARNERFGGMVGYETSFDSETYNDHHFHYGYFTLAGALLALVDDDFRDNYGDMLREITKDYANWDRNDTRYPFFRTFDPWSGHSFAGGLGDGNGNGQESTSEAMQGWGGMYLLGVALKDDAMRDAGLFGWVSEARGTAEYWFDRHKDNTRNMTTFHTKTNGDYEKGYNIDYSKFTAGYNDHGVEKTMTPPYNSNLTCHGVGYWTYFGFDAVFMQGIQWMPISPALDYLSEDKEFAAWDMQRMLDDTFHNGFLDNTGSATLADSDWGNVALSYYQRSNPQEVARIFDEGWTAGYGTYKTSSTNGITYFVTHSHLTYGDLDWSITASIPTARVYKKGDVKTYAAYNPTDAPVTVEFSDGGSLNVPARRMAVSTRASKSSNTIFGEEDDADVRDELVMENIALNKTAYTSTNENNTTQDGSKAVDGNPSTRWSSKVLDDQWIYIDLGKEAKIYQVKIKWEAAFAGTYKLQVSDDGESWTDAANELGAVGYVNTKMGDVTGRYVRMLCTQRSNNAYGVSMYEFEVYGQWSDAADDDLLGVKITSEHATLTQFQPEQISIKGYTVGKTWKNVDVVWSSKDGKITEEGVLTPRVAPTAAVKATVGVLKATKEFPVEEALVTSSIELSPRAAQIPVGESLTYEVSVKDQFGKVMNTNYNNLVWRVCTIDGDKVLTPTDKGSITPAGVVSFTTEGDYAVEVVDGAVADTVLITALAFADINLALDKPTEASSVRGDSKATNATDGKSGTRWESGWDNTTETLTVDLRAVYNINKVKVNWEAAYATHYKVQYSTDGLSWNDIADVTNGVAGIRTFDDFGKKEAQYIRIYCLTKALPAYGYSIYELEVYGTDKVREASPVLNDTGTDINNVHVLTGKWDGETFAAIDAANAEAAESDATLMPVAYDLRGVAGIEAGTSFDVINPNAIIIVSETQRDLLANSKNVVWEDGGNYMSRYIELQDGNRINKNITITANSVKYERTLTGKYSTITVPFDSNVPYGMKAYALTGYSDEGSEVRLLFDQVTTLSAGVPYIIDAVAGKQAVQNDNTVMVTFNENTTQPAGAAADKAHFHGNFTYRTNIPSGDNIYTLKGNGDGMLYHHVGGRITEFRGFFQLPDDASSKEYRVVLNGETDGIRSIENSELRIENYDYYNIAGQRVNGDYKGIVIKNGKKVKQ